MSKQPLISVALAFLAGVLFGEAFSFFPITLSVLILTLLLFETFLLSSRFLPLSLFTLWAIGFLFYQIASAPFSFSPGSNDLSRYIDQGPIRMIASVAAPPRHAPTHVSLRMKGIRVISDQGAHPVDGFFQLSIPGEENPFEYGDQLEMLIRLHRPNQYQNPGTFLYADYRERIGWDGLARLSHFNQAKKLGEGGNPILKIVYRWRDTIRHKIRASFDGPVESILMAMIIGESGYLSDEVREHFASSGAAHLLAVSGTHLAFVALFVFGLTRWCLLRLPESMLLRCSSWKIPSQWAALFTAGAVTFYALLAGSKLGTMRALTMILVYLISIWIGRSRETKTSLSLAALLILLFRPQAIFEISFQLSFVAVLSIVLFMEWWGERDGVADPLEPPEAAGIVRRYFVMPVRLLFLSTLSAAIGTAPLTLFLFHQFSWVALISNLVLLPLAGWVLIPFSLLCAIISLFFTEAFFLITWHEQLWSHFYALVRIFSGFPGADFHFASPSLLVMMLFYTLLLFGLTTRKSRKWLFVLTSFFFIIFLGWGSLRIPPGKLRVTVLDVGQGDATLIEFPHGKTMLIDGGTKRAGKFSIAPYLWQQRIRTIDYLVGTHPQFDHIGGLPYIIRSFHVKKVWTNDSTNESNIYRAFKEAIRKTDASHQVMTREKSPIEIEGCRFSIFHPPGDQVQGREDLNNRSLVFRMTCFFDREKPLSILFTGDIEKETEARLMESGSVLESTILKVPHHGSRSSSTQAFLTEVSPKIALFSVGRRNRYRHPHPEVMSRYEALGIENYRTDQQGAIFIEAKDPGDGTSWNTGSGLFIETYLETKRMRIRWADPVFSQEWNNIKKSFRWF